MEIAKRLKQIRREKRYTQEDIAEVLSMTQQQYSRYEVGTHEIPVRHLITLCRFYNVSSDWLLGLSETR